jgi:hypothetical protein
MCLGLRDHLHRLEGNIRPHHFHPGQATSEPRRKLGLRNFHTVQIHTARPIGKRASNMGETVRIQRPKRSRHSTTTQSDSRHRRAESHFADTTRRGSRHGNAGGARGKPKKKNWIKKKTQKRPRKTPALSFSPKPPFSIPVTLYGTCPVKTLRSLN